MTGQETTSSATATPLRSQDMEEIIGTPPIWLARYGTIFLVIVMLVLAGLASAYHYPSVVRGELTLTTIDPPRPLRAPQDFKVSFVNTHHNAKVTATQALVVAETQARFADVFDFTSALKKTIGISDNRLSLFDIDSDWNLGELQSTAYAFQEKQKAYQNIYQRRLDGKTTRTLEKLIRIEEKKVRDAQRGQGVLEEADFRTGAILKQAEDDFRLKLLEADELNDVRRRRGIASDRLQANRKVVREANFEIQLLQAQIESNRSGLSGGTLNQAARELRESHESLLSASDAWNRNFTLVSPIAGTVLLDRNIRAGAVVLRGDDVALVIPSNPGEIIGRMVLPVKGSAKIAEGQRVVVHFASYPYLEFGSVEGVVSAVDDLITENAFAVAVSFPDGLITNSGNELKATPLMTGEANIVTDDKPLLYRFLDRF
ncbi:MAG: hypothetical protein ACJAZ9_000216 [Neolewinella sp.]|jgi:hypothetical protein